MSSALGSDVDGSVLRQGVGPDAFCLLNQLDRPALMYQH